LVPVMLSFQRVLFVWLGLRGTSALILGGSLCEYFTVGSSI